MKDIVTLSRERERVIGRILRGYRSFENLDSMRVLEVLREEEEDA